jgi:hypothetical protein
MGLSPIAGEDPPSLLAAEQPLQVPAFVTALADDTFDGAVLSRFPRLDRHRAHVLGGQPAFDGLRDAFWAMVTASVAGQALLWPRRASTAITRLESSRWRTPLVRHRRVYSSTTARPVRASPCAPRSCTQSSAHMAGGLVASGGRGERGPARLRRRACRLHPLACHRRAPR